MDSSLMHNMPGRIVHILQLFCLAALLVIPLLVGDYWLFFIFQMVTAAYLAMSFNIAYSYGKVLSFAQGSFFALGAYLTAYLAAAAPWSLPVVLAAAVLGPGLIGGLVGLVLVRMDSHNATIATVIIATAGLLAGNAMRPFTGGEDGIRVTADTIGAGFFDVAIGANMAMYYIAVLPLAGLAIAMWGLQGTRWWTVLRAVSGNETRAQQLGFDVALRRLAAFTFSAALAGLGGAYYALMMAHVTTSVLDIALSVNAILWAVIGGVGTAFGPLLGVLLIYPATELVARVFLHVQILIGLLLLVVALLFPGGIIGSLVAAAQERSLHSKRTADDEPSSEVLAPRSAGSAK